jgi:hypothetical protein
MAKYNKFNIFDVKPREAFPPIIGREAQNISTELLEASDFIQKGIARVGIDGKLISNVTGEILQGNHVLDQIRSARMHSINELSVLTGGEADDAGYGILSGMVQTFNKKIQNGDLSEIIPELNGKKIEMVRFGFSKTDEKTSNILTGALKDAMGIPRSIDSGLAPGLFFPGDKSATLLSLRYANAEGGFTYLTGEQTINATNQLEMGIFNPQKLQKAFSGGSIENNAEFNVGSFFSKAIKRTKSITSERNTVIQGEQLQSTLKRIGEDVTGKFRAMATRPKDLSGAYLTYDARLEMTLKGLGLQGEHTQNVLNAAASTPEARLAAERMRGATELITSNLSEEYMKNTLKGYFTSADDFSAFEGIVKKTFNEVTASGEVLNMGHIEAAIQSSLELTSAQKSKIINGVSEMKRVTDGSSFIAGAFFDHHISGLEKSMKRLPSNSPERMKIQTQINLLKTDHGQMGLLEDQTTRLMLGAEGQIKAVADIKRTDIANRLLKEYGYIGAGSTELLKGEVTLGGSTNQGLTMALYNGSFNENVTADYQAIIHHGEEFNSQMAAEIRNTNELIKSDLDSFIKTRKDTY